MYTSVVMVALAGLSAAPQEAPPKVSWEAGYAAAYQKGQRMNPRNLDWENVKIQTQKLLSPSQWKAAEIFFLDSQYGHALDRAQESQNADSVPGSRGN